MDNKEAIEVLKGNCPHVRQFFAEALDMSIKALEAMESQTTAVQQLKAEICAFVVAVSKSKSMDETDSIVSKYCYKWRKHTAI